MFGPSDPETFWLNATNIGLGIVTLIAFVTVAVVAFREIAQRVRSRATVPVAGDDHAFMHAELGLTMADGGERLDKKPESEKTAGKPKAKKSVNK